eukprot:265365-Pyramimonas_sp.AAC.1
MAANMSQLYLRIGRPSSCLRISKAIRRWTPRATSCTACSGTTAAHLPSIPRATRTASSSALTSSARGGLHALTSTSASSRKCGSGGPREWAE